MAFFVRPHSQLITRILFRTIMQISINCKQCKYRKLKKKSEGRWKLQTLIRDEWCSIKIITRVNSRLQLHRLITMTHQRKRDLLDAFNSQQMCRIYLNGVKSCKLWRMAGHALPKNRISVDYLLRQSVRPGKCYNCTLMCNCKRRRCNGRMILSARCVSWPGWFWDSN